MRRVRETDARLHQMLIRAFRPRLDPGLHQFAGLGLRAGRRLAACAGGPAPGDEVVLADVLLQQREVAAAVAGGVLELAADLAEALALPGHLQWRHAPARMAGNALVA